MYVMNTDESLFVSGRAGADALINYIFLLNLTLHIHYNGINFYFFSFTSSNGLEPDPKRKHLGINITSHTGISYHVF